MHAECVLPLLSLVPTSPLSPPLYFRLPLLLSAHASVGQPRSSTASQDKSQQSQRPAALAAEPAERHYNALRNGIASLSDPRAKRSASQLPPAAMPLHRVGVQPHTNRMFASRSAAPMSHPCAGKPLLWLTLVVSLLVNSLSTTAQSSTVPTTGISAIDGNTNPVQSFIINPGATLTVPIAYNYDVSTTNGFNITYFIGNNIYGARPGVMVIPLWNDTSVGPQNTYGNVSAVALYPNNPLFSMCQGQYQQCTISVELSNQQSTAVTVYQSFLLGTIVGYNALRSVSNLPPGASVLYGSYISVAQTPVQFLVKPSTTATSTAAYLSTGTAPLAYIASSASSQAGSSITLGGTGFTDGQFYITTITIDPASSQLANGFSFQMIPTSSTLGLPFSLAMFALIGASVIVALCIIASLTCFIRRRRRLRALRRWQLEHPNEPMPGTQYRRRLARPSHALPALFLGVDKEVLDQLPIAKFDAASVPTELDATGKQVAPSCSICLNDYEQSEEISELPCRHYYHSTCIRSWLNKHNKCPLCNRTVNEHTIAQRLQQTPHVRPIGNTENIPAAVALIEEDAAHHHQDPSTTRSALSNDDSHDSTPAAESSVEMSDRLQPQSHTDQIPAIVVVDPE